MKFDSKQLESYFPKKPYDIQLDIANTIYSALEQNKTKLMIIQSPTGTGKTYSLLCPILAWLNNNQLTISHKKQEPKANLPVWLKKVDTQKGEKLKKEKERAIGEMVSIKNAKQAIKMKRKVKMQKEGGKTSKQASNEEDIEVESEQQENQRQIGKKNQKYNRLLQKQLKLQDENVLPKLIFVSRTHSQLTQVIDSIKIILRDKPHLNYLQLASKQHLCINKNINQNKNNVGELCQHLLDNDRCSFFHQLAINQFFDKNIEEIHEIGSLHDICPYYGSRNVMEYADVLCLPYSSILSQDIRQKLGININNSIIVFDEGHNLLEFEKQMHSPEIRIEEIETFAEQVDEYLKKYGEKLKVKNYRLLTHLLDILRGFATAVAVYSQGNKTNKEQKKYLKIKYLDFLGVLSLKQMKIQQVIRYIQLNNMDKKLTYFNINNQFSNKKQHKFDKAKISIAIINRVLSFMLQFVQFTEHKQSLLLKWGQSRKGILKILCFESTELEKIIDKSRLAIVAGGTMEPLDQFIKMSWKWKDRLTIKKYSHIIKEQQCKIYTIKKTGSREILFNHRNFNQPQAAQDYKQICTSVVRKVINKTEKGGGIVIFIQNYQLIPFFQNIFKGEDYQNNILYDHKEKSDNEAEDLFTKYKKNIELNSNQNYILVSVMGGKLSEGINFSDKLARSLIVFGLPYSNIYSAEIVQTMSYLDRTKYLNYSGKEYYQNLCIKTLNQTIGRGVRHINDYVNIFLVDSRFEGIKDKLSDWMKPRMQLIKNLEDL